jgi:hypothetical protein
VKGRCGQRRVDARSAPADFELMESFSPVAVIAVFRHVLDMAVVQWNSAIGALRPQLGHSKLLPLDREAPVAVPSIVSELARAPRLEPDPRFDMWPRQRHRGLGR